MTLQTNNNNNQINNHSLLPYNKIIHNIGGFRAKMSKSTSDWLKMVKYHLEKNKQGFVCLSLCIHSVHYSLIHSYTIFKK